MASATVRSVMWAPWDGPGLEHLALAVGPREVVADGVAIGIAEGAPFRLRYRIRCGGDWRVSTVRLDVLDEAERSLVLHGDGAGRWTTGAGAPLAEIEGCIDVDIAATPFTNTLPIRRLGLADGESRDLDMAYLTVPELGIERDGQRYIRLDAGRYRYQGLGSGFTAELAVDGDGLVLDYPGLFRRLG